MVKHILRKFSRLLLPCRVGFWIAKGANIFSVDSLLREVLEFYLKSPDFNGFHLRDTDQATRAAAAELVKAGLLEVISDKDYPNAHIRPSPSRRTQDDQLQDIADSVNDDRVVCLYPNPAALADRLDLNLYADEPYRRRQAEGGGRLEIAYFRFDVLEAYRNDPRYLFEYGDFGLWTSISDDCYMDDKEHGGDKTSISTSALRMIFRRTTLMTKRHQSRGGFRVPVRPW